MERNDFMIAASKGALSGAYLLHGEEEFLKENAVSSALKLIDSAMRDLNVDILENAQATAVIAAAETLPFMPNQMNSWILFVFFSFYVVLCPSICNSK